MDGYLVKSIRVMKKQSGELVDPATGFEIIADITATDVIAHKDYEVVIEPMQATEDSDLVVIDDNQVADFIQQQLILSRGISIDRETLMDILDYQYDFLQGAGLIEEE